MVILPAVADLALRMMPRAAMMQHALLHQYCFFLLLVSITSIIQRLYDPSS
jgi:hypothetical protein